LRGFADYADQSTKQLSCARRVYIPSCSFLFFFFFKAAARPFASRGAIREIRSIRVIRDEPSC